MTSSGKPKAYSTTRSPSKVFDKVLKLQQTGCRNLFRHEHIVARYKSSTNATHEATNRTIRSLSYDKVLKLQHNRSSTNATHEATHKNRTAKSTSRQVIIH